MEQTHGHRRLLQNFAKEPCVVSFPWLLSKPSCSLASRVASVLFPPRDVAPIQIDGSNGLSFQKALQELVGGDWSFLTILKVGLVLG